MARGIVGVDIGHEAIRAVELTDAVGERPTVTRMHQVPLPPGAAASGDVLEVHTVASALKRLWGEGGFRSKDVVLGMGNQRVLARDVTVPRMSLKQIRESLPFQVQEMLPVPVAEAILDFYPVSETLGESGPMVNGLLVAAVKEAVLANVTAASLAGLSAVEVDLIPFALTRLHLRGDPGGTAAIVNVGATTTSITVATDRVPQFVRIIPSGGDEATIALMERLTLERPHADDLKRNVGLLAASGDGAQQRAVEVIHEVTWQLLTGIRNTINYFLHARGRPIERLVLSGGGAMLPGFADALAEVTRLPVTFDDGFGAVQLPHEPAHPAPVDGARVGMTVALGLALGSRS